MPKRYGWERDFEEERAKLKIEVARATEGYDERVVRTVLAGLLADQTRQNEKFAFGREHGGGEVTAEGVER